MTEQDKKMKQRLREYLDTILEDAPAGERTEELRTELYQNMCDRYDDMIAEGRTPAAAYNSVVAGLGDISPLLEEADRPIAGTTLVGDEDDHASSTRATEERRSAWKRHHRRSAILTPVAIMLYILCVIPVILLEDCNENLGIVLMFSCVALATGLLIFDHMSKPTGYSASAVRSDEKDELRDPDETEAEPSPRTKLYKTVSGVLWILTVLVYLGISLLTMRWGITWLIFLVAVAADHLIEALFDL